MKIAIMQPYLFPYIGYFQLINAVDKFIVHDDVKWIKGGWINRNRIFLNNKEELITLSVKKRGNYDNINQFEVLHEQNNQKKFLNKVRAAYIKSPYFSPVFPILEKIILNDESNLTRYILFSLEQINTYLQIGTEIFLSSEIKKNNELKAQARVIDICKAMNANGYINPIGGVSLYNKDTFKQNGINLCFLNTKNIQYKQCENKFIPGLSIIDVMMFNDKEEIIRMLDSYELV